MPRRRKTPPHFHPAQGPTQFTSSRDSPPTPPPSPPHYHTTQQVTINTTPHHSLHTSTFTSSKQSREGGTPGIQTTMPLNLKFPADGKFRKQFHPSPEPVAAPASSEPESAPSKPSAAPSKKSPAAPSKPPAAPQAAQGMCGK